MDFEGDHSADGGDCTPKRSRKQREGEGKEGGGLAGRSHIGLPKPPREGGRHDNDSRVAPRAEHARPRLVEEAAAVYRRVSSYNCASFLAHGNTDCSDRAIY